MGYIGVGGGRDLASLKSLPSLTFDDSLCEGISSFALAAANPVPSFYPSLHLLLDQELRSDNDLQQLAPLRPRFVKYWK